MNYEQTLFIIGIPIGLTIFYGLFKFIMWTQERIEK